jgi:hypothetical protein
MKFFKQQGSPCRFGYQVGASFAQSKLRLLLNKSPDACKQPESRFIALALS